MKSKIDFTTTKLLAGIDKLYNAVSITLGPRARGVAVARAMKTGEVYDRTVLDDGLKIARGLELEDEFENMGLALVREASMKQVDTVGDGSTVVIILATAIIKEAMKQIAQGANPMQIRADLERGRDILLKELDKYKIEIKSDEETIQIATVSSKDPELGKLIAGAFKKMGPEGIVTVEESKSLETLVDYQTGMQFDKGWASPYFITDPETMQSTLEETYVLVADIPVSDFEELTPFLNEFVAKKRPLTVISPSYGGTALPSFIQNKLEGKLLSLLINAPSFGEHQKEMLADIAVLTGGRFISQDAGGTLKDITMDDLGRASYVTSKKDSTVISGGKGKKEEINLRVKQIESLLKAEKGEFNREKLKERLAKLTQGVAVIKVGGATEGEMKERKERVDDAVSATRASLKNGIVAGGEIIYLRLRDKVDGILNEALKKPFYVLLENAGLDVADYLNEVTKGSKHTGVDVTTGEICDMVERGIIDPKSVAESAIRNAVSVGSMVILTGAVVVPIINEKHKDQL